MDVCGDDYYGDDNSDTNNSYDDRDEDDEYMITDKNYEILTVAKLEKRQEDEISKVSTSLSIPRNAATLLLHHYRWTDTKLFDDWFDDEDKVREEAGLLNKERNECSCSRDGELTCNICFDSFTLENFTSAVCGHCFCKICYVTYITGRIHDGMGCLTMRCPEWGCKVVVDRDMIEGFRELSDEYKSKYNRFLVRSYVEESRKSIIKWCPGKDCDNAVQLFESNSRNFDVTCECSWEFCWNCQEEMHSPVDCETAGNWIRKNGSESENMNWVIAYTKPCPKCKSPIEKNAGCSHMTCRFSCKHQFCWLCLGDWNNHNHRCNTYDQRAQGAVNEEEKKRSEAKQLIQRYNHYYQRWANNHSSRMKSRGDLEKVRTQDKWKLAETYGKTEIELRALEEAWIQIIECRRILRWSYAYGYYIPRDNLANKNLFEDLQWQAESNLEKLHKCVETDVLQFLLESEPGLGLPGADEYKAFDMNLKNLTLVVKNFFHSLFIVMQNGLEHVDSFPRNKKQKQ
ncbi:probable E3 ubiquitin-protein ligase ARI8 [Mercurialis annua]|uniref:probable E3 ubiquitin-protein ligase ARI8 n=1 Tax=Mercurialis annua TaxID=3986 RepID=UPI002160B57C|nr:probable E3 ubiquitin-protein ligase ARI8 [Mercurialis annua]